MSPQGYRLRDNWVLQFRSSGHKSRAYAYYQPLLGRNRKGSVRSRSLSPRPVLFCMKSRSSSPNQISQVPRATVTVLATPEQIHREKIGRAPRLNSSHGSSSYAVFCLKKKNDVLARFRFEHTMSHASRDAQGSLLW